MMSGPAVVKQKIADYLKQDVPERIIKYRNLWNLDARALPTPDSDSYLTFAPPSLEYMIDELPALYTVILSTSSINRYGYDDEHNPLYEMQYAARTYIWVESRGFDDNDGMEAASIARDSLTTVVRSSLLDQPSFNTHDSHEWCEVLFDEGTMREEFSDIEASKGDFFYAAAYIEYTLTVTEVNTRDTMGKVLDIQPEVYRFLLED